MSMLGGGAPPFVPMPNPQTAQLNHFSGPGGRPFDPNYKPMPMPPGMGDPPVMPGAPGGMGQMQAAPQVGGAMPPPPAAAGMPDPSMLSAFPGGGGSPPFVPMPPPNSGGMTAGPGPRPMGPGNPQVRPPFEPGGVMQAPPAQIGINTNQTPRPDLGRGGGRPFGPKLRAAVASGQVSPDNAKKAAMLRNQRHRRNRRGRAQGGAATS